MKKLKLLGILLFLTFVVNAQKNSIYLELLGAGPMASINYETEIIPNSQLNLRVGLGYLSTWTYEGLTIPTAAYHLIDLNKGNNLELGMSYTFTPSSDNEEGIGFLLPAIGYRKYYEGKKGFFKITFNPILFDSKPVQVLPWGGISFGIRF
jgi:hypothetical protein